MRSICLLLLITCIYISCKNEKPAFRFSNFDNTLAKNIVKAIENNDVETIREEVLNKQVDINFEDEKYEVSLLELALVNNKKEAFEELLKLGANPNIENSSCVSPLISAIRYNRNCELFYIEKLLDNDANITPKFFNKCSNFTHDPISETILQYNDENRINCGLKILKLLTSKLDNPDLLNLNNNPEDFHENIIYNCLNTNRNLSALKYLIIDLKFKVPEKIYIDGTVMLHFQGYKSLEEILYSRDFTFNESNKFREKAKMEILNFIKNK